MRLHHVQIAIPPREEDTARKFYRDVLGLIEREKPSTLSPAGVWFRKGSLELHLGVQDDFQPARKAHPAILVNDLDDITARLESAKAEVQVDNKLPSYRRIYTNDPFGNRIEFLQANETPHGSQGGC